MMMIPEKRQQVCWATVTFCDVAMSMMWMETLNVVTMLALSIVIQRKTTSDAAIIGPHDLYP